MRIFFGAHHLRFPAIIIPATRRLHLRNAGIELFSLTLDLEQNRPSHRRGGVEVFQFDLCAQGIVGMLAQGNVHITAHLTFFHVGIRHPTLHHDHLQAPQVGKSLLRRLQIRFTDNLHQGRARAIEVDQR